MFKKRLEEKFSRKDLTSIYDNAINAPLGEFPKMSLRDLNEIMEYGYKIECEYNNGELDTFKITSKSGSSFSFFKYENKWHFTYIPIPMAS